MNFKKIRMMMATLMACSLAIVSCSEKLPDNGEGGEGGNKPNPNENIVTLSRETEYGDDWVYYSLENRKEVSVAEADHANSLDWDLAFNRYNVRTNSGKSGKGQGGAAITEIKNLKDCTAVPEGLEFTTDVVYTISAPGSGFPPPEMESTANEVMCQAIRFAGPPPTYTPSEYVFIVRTASGKFAKFKAISFYDETGNSGVWSFEYEMM